MSPKAQNIAILEACGWKRVVKTYEWSPCGQTRLPKQWHMQNDDVICNAPDYLGDLNACAEFERIISTEGREEGYLRRLSEEGRGDGRICFKVSEADHWACATATAGQRAKAFLRTMDLWVEVAP